MTKKPTPRKAAPRKAAPRKAARKAAPRKAVIEETALMEPVQTSGRRVHMKHDVVVAVGNSGQVTVPLPSYRMITEVVLLVHPHNILRLSLTDCDNYMVLNVGGHSLRNDAEHHERPRVTVPLGWDGIDTKKSGFAKISLELQDDYPVYVKAIISSYITVVDKLVT